MFQLVLLRLLLSLFDHFYFINSLSLTPSRTQSHSSDSSFEDDFGVRKEVLLHGTYDDYIKEYKSRSAVSSSSKAPPSMADIAAAYQKALSHVASALQQQGSSSKVCIILFLYHTSGQRCMVGQH